MISGTIGTCFGLHFPEIIGQREKVNFRSICFPLASVTFVFYSYTVYRNRKFSEFKFKFCFKLSDFDKQCAYSLNHINNMKINHNCIHQSYLINGAFCPNAVNIRCKNLYFTSTKCKNMWANGHVFQHSYVDVRIYPVFWRILINLLTHSYKSLISHLK